MISKANILRKAVGAVFSTALTALLLVSCDIYDDLPPCPRGVNLRFTFDYNLEQKDSFNASVHCLTLFIYDEQGNFCKTITEVGDKLKDKNFHIPIELAHGNYRILGYGGMACENRSFDPVETPAIGSKLTDLQVEMHQKDAVSNVALHDFFYGAMDFTVYGEMHRDTTLNLMKNTNKIRVMLKHSNGLPLEADSFKFSITDDNTLFDYNNHLLANGGVTYLPWEKGEALYTKAVDDEVEKTNAAFATFSTSRLMAGKSNRLKICRASGGEPIVDIDLNQYLLLLNDQQYGALGAQEFLDRESDWTLEFFLNENNIWIRTYIIVNDWVVRINDTEL